MTAPTAPQGLADLHLSPAAQLKLTLFCAAALLGATDIVLNTAAPAAGMSVDPLRGAFWLAMSYAVLLMPAGALIRRLNAGRKAPTPGESGLATVGFGLSACFMLTGMMQFVRPLFG